MTRSAYKRFYSQGAKLPKMNGYPTNKIGYNMNSCCGANKCECTKKRKFYTDNIACRNLNNKSKYLNQADGDPSILEQLLGVKKGEPAATLNIDLSNPTLFKMGGVLVGSLVLGHLINKNI